MIPQKRKVLALATVVLLVCACGWGAYLYISAGELRSVEPHFAGRCVKVSGVVGAEDITIHPGGVVAYVSSHDRRAAMAGTPTPGAIFAYHLRGARRGELVNLTPRPLARFHPHGVGLHVEAGKPDLLLVVNHPRSPLFGGAVDGPPHTVEVFVRTGDRLVHQRTITDPALVSPNDVSPVDRTRFYVTNDHGSGTMPGHMFEDFLRLARSSVLYFDGRTFSRAAEGLRYANGVAVSRDGRVVHVASSTDRNVTTYDRDEASGSLRRRGSVFIDTGADNIELDGRGDLWVGAHPKLLTFVFHAKDPAVKAPSQAVKLSARAGGGFNVEEVFLSDGSDLSASSVAARHGDRLLLGGVFDPHLLDCTMSGGDKKK